MAVDIRKPLKKLLPHLLRAREENLNEADTLQRIIKVFEEVLGYDPLSELSREAQVKDRYVDVAVKLDGTVQLLVEAKSAATLLRDRHIEQAQHYAAQSNIPWVLLTNGLAWNLYHLSFEEGIEYVRVFAVDLAEDDIDKATESLSLLHRQSIMKGELEEYWEHRVALSPDSIGRALFTEEVLRLVRREIRRQDGILIDPEDLAAAIYSMLSTEAQVQIGSLKIRRRRKVKPRAILPDQETSPPEEPSTDSGKGVSGPKS